MNIKDTNPERPFTSAFRIPKSMISIAGRPWNLRHGFKHFVLGRVGRKAPHWWEQTSVKVIDVGRRTQNDDFMFTVDKLDIRESGFVVSGIMEVNEDIIEKYICIHDGRESVPLVRPLFVAHDDNGGHYKYLPGWMSGDATKCVYTAWFTPRPRRKAKHIRLSIISLQFMQPVNMPVEWHNRELDISGVHVAFNVALT